ncbi:16098_t:CDS:2 [Entrophospora sp. SA101]|nr:7392_t:CDS:2 [Entrophospora sp. SA101]CAJ0629437.1 15568_t:CDS:2 [Entrophospora sp. SA101]CAJ0761139.1 16098_t:CDS:2 [Entrophospora sp. SA101]CAJ0824712.1 6759_t:CDS:2 [Entrophospora sp. SA101]CAJ0830596.1 5590_t:CDS:2 [Entrophospora sp. SA101]
MADIKQKRQAKSKGGGGEAILKQIQKLFSSDAYQEKKLEIQAVENHLQELDPKKFKETIKKSLDEQVKNNGLTESNMDDETKQELAEAKQDPTTEKVAIAKEKIAQNGANNNLNNLLTET